MDFFRKASTVFEHIFVMPGNHDARAVGYAIDFLSMMNIENLTYINPLKSKQFVYEICDGLYGFFLPYIEVERISMGYYDFVAEYSDQIKKDQTILIAHLYDDHVKIGSESQLITKYVSNVSYKNFNTWFDTIVSGHIHTHQIYDVNNVKVIYPGTMQSFTKHDVDLQKKIMLMDNNKQDEWVDVPHILFTEREMEGLDNTLFEDLDKERQYVIYLNVKNSSEMKHDFYDWIEEQYRNNPNIVYINPVFIKDSSTLSVNEVHASGSGNVLFRDILQRKLEENIDNLPTGSNKDGIIKEIDTFILR